MALPPEITCAELKAWLEDPARPQPVLVDVRNPDEWAWVRLDGATLLPLPELPDRAEELEPHRSRALVVYCHHGVRSLDGAGFLSELGFEATSLRGGIDAWARLVDPSKPRY